MNSENENEKNAREELKTFVWPKRVITYHPFAIEPFDGELPKLLRSVLNLAFPTSLQQSSALET